MIAYYNSRLILLSYLTNDSQSCTIVLGTIAYTIADTVLYSVQ